MNSKEKIKRILWDIVHFFLNNVFCHIPFSSLRKIFYKTIFRMKIGKRVYIGRNVKFLSPWKISIGDNTRINSGAFLDGRFSIFLGKNVDIAWYSVLLTAQHDLNDKEYKAYGESIIVGDRAVIATKALVLPGISIGEGAVIAAGSIVTHNIAPYDIVGGNPAKRIKIRSRNLEYKL